VNARRVQLIVAVVLALGAGILTLRLLGTYAAQQQAAPAVAPKDVLVATQDIQARAKISPDMFVKTQRPAEQAGAEPISDPKVISGDIALVAIPTNTIITSTIVGRPPESTLTVTLRPGMRAITIPIDRVKAVAGLLQPGDRVDVVAVPPKAGNRPPIGATIIRGALVMAINATTDTSGSTPSPDNGGAGTATLGVTPKQANLIAMADLNTTLRLALRSPQEPVRSLPPDDLVFDTNAPPAAAPIVFTPQVAPPGAIEDLSKYGLQQPGGRDKMVPAVLGAPPAAGPPAVEVIDGSTVISGPATK